MITVRVCLNNIFSNNPKTFQLIVQAAGRAGRGNLSGQVYIQTMRPDHKVVETGISHDYQSFAAYELGFREATGQPPFTRMVQIELSSLKKDSLERASRKLRDWLDNLTKSHPQALQAIQVVGPMTPAVEVIRKRFRKKMILTSLDIKPLHQLSKALLNFWSQLKSPVHLQCDVDPQTLM